MVHDDDELEFADAAGAEVSLHRARELRLDGRDMMNDWAARLRRHVRVTNVAATVTVRVRPDADAEQIAEIWRLGWADAHLGFVPQELVQARTDESFRERAEDRTGDTTVAVVEDAVAGFVMVVGDEVEQVYVSAAHRGTGVAFVLLAEAERQVAVNGHAEAWLAVVAGNARARASTSGGLERGPVRLHRHRGRRADRGAVPSLHEAPPPFEHRVTDR